MTDNPNRIPFFALPREDQDRIAGAIARGEPVEFWTDVLGGEWREKDGKEIMLDRILRIPPDPKPAKDPNRPRPAHKLNLQKGDVVRHVGWQDGRIDTKDKILVGGPHRYWAFLHLNIK